MAKRLFIAEKPSVAQEFAKALKVNAPKRDGYIESEDTIVTWCVGHLVTMSYPDAYDPALKKWSLTTLPFIPDEFLYEVIPNVSKQFNIVKTLLNREDVETIYVCTDSGREGEYIYRLVDQAANVSNTKDKRRVWIDSQTEEEILRGIKEAKPLSEYDNLSDAAYLRAKEDYLMGINFSRVLTLKYGNTVTNYLKSEKWSAISVGRVMTCVLGMVVRREREVRAFIKTPFYKVSAKLETQGSSINSEWKAVLGSRFFETPFLYKENGFKDRIEAEKMVFYLLLKEGASYEEATKIALEQDNQKKIEQYLKKIGEGPDSKNKPSFMEINKDVLSTEVFMPRPKAIVQKVDKKKENKNAPLLFNLAELQNVCSKMFKISPDETLKVTQELYEKKLVTYPRTDARVLSTAVSKEIYKNIGGLRNFTPVAEYAKEVLENGSYKNIAKTRYVNDKQITDHYAIIPTGQGFAALNSISTLAFRVYEVICKRFLSIFYPPAVYQKVLLEVAIKEEHFFTNFKVLIQEGYFKVAGNIAEGASKSKKKLDKTNKTEDAINESSQEEDDEDVTVQNENLVNLVSTLKKGMELDVSEMNIKEGETSPPKRYSSGTIILAMENAGQLIEDEELRAQIKGSGIGTSATRAEILNKLVRIQYLNLNNKTQIITPTQLGEIIYDVVDNSIRSLLNAELTASWEKGLTYVEQGTITKEEYMQKLDSFVTRMTDGVKGLNNQYALRQLFDKSAVNY